MLGAPTAAAAAAVESRSAVAGAAAGVATERPSRTATATKADRSMLPVLSPVVGRGTAEARSATRTARRPPTTSTVPLHGRHPHPPDRGRAKPGVNRLTCWVG